MKCISFLQNRTIGVFERIVAADKLYEKIKNSENLNINHIASIGRKVLSEKKN